MSPVIDTGTRRGKRADRLIFNSQTLCMFNNDFSKVFSNKVVTQELKLTKLSIFLLDMHKKTRDFLIIKNNQYSYRMLVRVMKQSSSKLGLNLVSAL